MAFTYREGLGRPLTYQEMDDNLEYVEQLAQQSEQHADQAAQDAVISQQARDEAVQSAAVVTGATSLTPEPGRIPLADGEGKISADWLGMSASGKTVATGTPAQGRTALGLGTAALRADDYFATAEQVGDIASALDAINGEVI